MLIVTSPLKIVSRAPGFADAKLTRNGSFVHAIHIELLRKAGRSKDGLFAICFIFNQRGSEGKSSRNWFIAPTVLDH
jgi:hypothetical protein